MHLDGAPFVYLCAFAHCTNGTLTISTECRTLDRPIDPEGLAAIDKELQERGFLRAAVISFALFGPLHL